MSLVSLPAKLVYPLRWMNSSAVPSTAGVQTITTGTYSALVFQAAEDMTVTQADIRIQSVSSSGTGACLLVTVDTATGLATSTDLGGGSPTSVALGVLSTGLKTVTFTNSVAIARGAYFAIKFTHTSGTSYSVTKLSNLDVNAHVLPYLDLNGTKTILTSFPAVSFSNGSTPYAVGGCLPVSAVINATLTSTPANSEHGCRFQIPFKARCIGARVYQGGQTGNFNLILRADGTTNVSLGSELSSSSTLIEGINQIVSAAAAGSLYFDNPVTLDAGTWYRIGVQPTTATATGISALTMLSAGLVAACPGGLTNQYYTYDGTTLSDSTTSIPILAPIFDQIDYTVASGGAHIIGG